MADRETCSAVEERLFPVAGETTPGVLRRRVRRILAAVAPEAVKERAARARQRLFVQVRACDVPGVSEWFAHLSSEDSVLCWAAIDEAAHQSKACDPGRSIDQCRAEALADLILGRAEVSAHVIFPIPVGGEGAPGGSGHPDDSGQAEDRYHPDDRDGVREASDLLDAGAHEPHQQPRNGDAFFRHASGVEVGGLGVIQGDVIERLLNRFETTISAMFVDVKTGTTLGTTSALYRPPVRMRELVRLRDGTCRFPGCPVAARRCDLDHVVPWSSESSRPSADGWGRTEPGNLMCLCRRHHRLKTQARWTPMLDPVTAAVTWSDPYGERWLTRPVDHRQPDVA